MQLRSGTHPPVRHRWRVVFLRWRVKPPRNKTRRRRNLTSDAVLWRGCLEPFWLSAGIAGNFSQPAWTGRMVRCLQCDATERIDCQIDGLHLRYPKQLGVSAMHKPSVPSCLKCGNSTPTLFSSRPRYAITDPAHTQPPIGTFYVYSCSCGVSFTHEDDVIPPCRESRVAIG